MTGTIQLSKPYEVWLFDCDGVLLDSNAVKTEAFRRAALPYGREAAEALVAHHVENGGISRYRKFEHFFQNILGRTDFEADYRSALEAYAAEARRGLMECPEVPGAREFLEKIRRKAPRLTAVVSGSDEAELKDVLAQRDLARYFDHIKGSPTPKNDIVAALMEEGKERPAVLFGDSRADRAAALNFGVDFVMIYGYSEWRSWREETGETVPASPDFRTIRFHE